MTIKKYLGKTKEEALEAARRELGANMVVMNVKEIRKTGLFSFFAKKSYEVTAAVEDDTPTPRYLDVVEAAHNAQAENMRRFDAVVGQDAAVLPQPETGSAKEPVAPGPRPAETVQKPEPQPQPALTKEEEELRSVFRAVGEVVAQANVNGSLAKSAVSTYDRNATVIKYRDPASSEYTRTHTPDRREPLRRDEPQGWEQTVLEPNERLVPVRSDNAPNAIIKAIYNMLLDHEVDERYINQVMADLDIDAMEDNIETALNLVYQKLILKFGPIHPITLEEKRPKVVFFIGPTGVGKTTTIAKIASEFKLNQKRRVALFTADTYRIAAEKQLSVYGDLMQIDVVILYEADDINEKIAEKYAKYDLILVDTTGFSHRDKEQKESISLLLHSLNERYDKQTFLVLPVTTKYRDLKEIVDTYHEFTDFDLIFTKLDETEAHGNILNIKLYSDSLLSYVTTGQSVPSDIEIIDAQKMVRGLLGGA